MNPFNREYLTEGKQSKWIEVSNGYSFGAVIDKAGYFDERPVLHITLTQIISIVALFFVSFPYAFFLILPILFGWGKIYIKLPIKTGIVGSDSAGWGFSYGDDTFWLYTGGNSDGRKFKAFYAPWFLEWYRTSILLSDNTWCHEHEGDRKDFWHKEKWHDYRLEIDVIHKSTGLEATATIVEREWKRRILYNLPIKGSIRRMLEFEFKDPYAARKLSGAYDILPDENILDALEKIGFTSKSLNRIKKIEELVK